MIPKFILPARYEARLMQLVLTRAHPRGWRFYGRHDGYCVLARNACGAPLFDGKTFRTREEASIAAAWAKLPAYAVWNGRTRRYDGAGFETMAYVRDRK